MDTFSNAQLRFPAGDVAEQIFPNSYQCIAPGPPAHARALACALNSIPVVVPPSSESQLECFERIRQPSYMMQVQLLTISKFHVHDNSHAM